MKLRVITAGTHLDSSSSLGLPTPLSKERTGRKRERMKWDSPGVGGLMDGLMDLKVQRVALKRSLGMKLDRKKIVDRKTKTK